MLSRVAERLYWLGRYIERAENTARLVMVNNNLLLDLPASAGVLWESLLELLATAASFRERHHSVSERQVIRWVMADEHNESSLVSSLRAARENARTVREVIPSESWELINDLYWSAQDTAESGIARKSRQSYLDGIVLKSQQFAGMLHNTMSHREPFQFLMLGATLERADMTSRIVDVGAGLAQRARIEHLLGPVAQRTAQPDADGYREPGLRAVDEGARNMAVEHLAQQELAPSVTALQRVGQA